MGVSDAVEVIEARSPAARVLLTCEHASERLPEPWQWPAADRWLVGTHWAYDLGAAALTRELAEAFGAAAVLARFSRLLADPNRPEESPELFRGIAEGRAVTLNASIDAAEREARLGRLWRPYHAALQAQVEQSPAPVLLAVHSFTPVYEGQRRQLEVGVLFARDEALARQVYDAVAASGMSVALNEPYSGKGGYSYSVDWHAERGGRRAVELEVRQDLAVQPALRARLVAALGFLKR